MFYRVKQNPLGGWGGLGLPRQPTYFYLVREAARSAHPLVQPQGLFVKSTLADR